MRWELLVAGTIGLLMAGVPLGCGGRQHAESGDSGTTLDSPTANPGSMSASGDGSALGDVPIDTLEVLGGDASPVDFVSLCPAGKHQCPGNADCVPVDSLAACGASCAACTAPTGSTATCVAGACDFDCGALKKCVAAQQCIPTSGCCVQGDCPMQGGKVGTCDPSNHTCNYGCPADMTACGGACIPKGGCCVDNDCPGSCQKCVNHACTTATGQDDPNGRCSGTCDVAGKCKSKQGQHCTSATADACIAGTSCADGYCCDQVCGANCMACDVAGLEGKCSPVVSGGPRGGRGACASDGTACAGACRGRADGQCDYPTTSCGAAMCVGASGFVPQRTCNGGSCGTATMQMCGNGFACVGSACKTTCAADSDCQSGYACSGNTCRPVGSFCDGAHPCQTTSYCSVAGTCMAKKQNGDGCQAATECTQGICVDGVCCNSACNGACEACNQAGTLGQCTPVHSRDDDHCLGTQTCDASGNCKNKAGQGCGGPGDCATGNCVDARCCTTNSCGFCQACTGAAGTCIALTKTTCYQDADGDTYGTNVTQPFCQSGCPGGWATRNGDCVDDPANPQSKNINPGAGFSDTPRPDGSWDWNCSGRTEFSDNPALDCDASCNPIYLRDHPSDNFCNTLERIGGTPCSRDINNNCINGVAPPIVLIKCK